MQRPVRMRLARDMETKPSVPCLLSNHFQVTHPCFTTAGFRSLQKPLCEELHDTGKKHGVPLGLSQGNQPHGVSGLHTTITSPPPIIKGMASSWTSEGSLQQGKPNNSTG